MKKFLSLLCTLMISTVIICGLALNVSAATEVADPIDWTDLAESYDGTFMVLEDSPVYGNGEIESPIVGFKGTFQRQLHGDIKNAWGTKYTYQQTMTQPVEGNEVSLTYNLGDRDVVAFTLRAYMPNDDTGMGAYYLDFYASKDGNTWDKLTENAAVNGYTLTKGDYNSVTTDAETGATVYGNFREHVFSSDSLLEGYKYLKVQLPYIQNRPSVWLLQVGKMKIAFDTTDAPTALNTLATMPCEISGAIYNDTPGSTYKTDDNTLRTVHKNVNNQGATRINLDLRNDQNQNGTSHTYGRGTGDRGTLTWNDTAAFAELMRGSGITYYNTDFDMTGFALWSYTGTLDNRGSIFFWVSEDGEEWTKLEKHTDYKMNFGNLALTTSGSKYEVVYYADSLPKGTRYLKFEFSRTLDNPTHHWQTQIGKICVGFDDHLGLIDSPIEFTNTTYVDDCINDWGVDVTNSKGKKLRIRTPLNIQGLNITGDVNIAKRRGEERSVRRSETKVKAAEDPAALEYGLMYTSPERDITDVAIWAHAPNGIELYTSKDGGVTFTPFELSSREPSSVPAYPKNEWNISLYWAENLPAGTTNIKVLIPSAPTTTSNFWDTEVYKIVWGYDEDINFTNSSIEEGEEADTYTVNYKAAAKSGSDVEYTSIAGIYSGGKLVAASVADVKLTADGTVASISHPIKLAGFTDEEKSAMNVKVFAWDDVQKPIWDVVIDESFADLFKKKISGLSEVLPSDENLTYYGRWTAADDGSMLGNWNEPYVKFNFSGTVLKVDLKGSGATARVKVDNALYSISGSGVHEISSDLADSVHSAEIRIINADSSKGIAKLYVAEGAELTPYTATAKNVQFIGDSITTSSASYSFTIPSAYGLDSSVISVNGIALMDGSGYFNASAGNLTASNRVGMESAYFGEKAPNYAYTSSNGILTYTNKNADLANEPTPDVIVINLGTNDAAFINNGTVTADDFTAAYVGFVNKLTAQYPNADIYMLRQINNSADYSSIYDNMRNATVAAYDELKANTKVHYVDTTEWNVEISSDNVHPSASGYNALKTYVYNAIADSLN